MNRKLMLLAFALSGMAALIYEVTWTRMLRLIFGSTVYAVSAILTTFFIGFALGSYLFRNRADNSKNPILLFSLLEFGIGLYGLMIIPVFGFLSTVYLLTSSSGYKLFQFIFSFIAIITPAILIGATWPVVSKAYVRNVETLGNDSGMLYSMNSLGSFTGPITAGFVLIPILGITNTNLFAACVNMFIAFLMFAKGRMR